MDAQKSPLAMLAATCNSIGAPDLQKTIKSVELPPTSKRSAPISNTGSENKRPRPSPDTSSADHKSSTKSLPSSESSHKRDSPEKDPKEKPTERLDKEKSESTEGRKSPKTSLSPRLGSKTPPKPTPRSPHGLPLPVSFPIVHGASPLSDPLNFVARLKNGSGGSMPHMMPGYCRDPFCYGCSASQSLQCATNPPMTPMDYSALSKSSPDNHLTPSDNSFPKLD